ncbi:hypothetical protein [Specibacter sp. NPDC078692]|uniref:hypothetical protein n=1 Tax=Specibacter sp. NPDC078692 TaxID=3155818 RepID=UPI003448535F
MVRAALPNGSYARPEAVTDTGNGVYVRFTPESGGRPKDFEFRKLGFAPEIESAVVAGFAMACGPGGSRKTVESAKTLYAGARILARKLQELPSPPQTLGALVPAHLASFKLSRTRYSHSLIQLFRVLFRRTAGLSPEFREALYAPHGWSVSSSGSAAYADSEARRIQRAARSEVRTALARIRKIETELERWKQDDPGLEAGARQRCALLDRIFRGGTEAPRLSATRKSPPQQEESSALLPELFPSYSEITALAVLLICVSGQNLSTVCGLTADHLRADDQETEEPLIMTRASKPRRGRHGAEMDLAMAPSHVPALGRDDYSSAAGVYRVAHELCARVREIAKTSSLLVFYSSNVGPGAPEIRQLPTAAVENWRGKLPDGTVLSRINTRRLRLTYIQRHQRPVAHSATTAAREYLSKDAEALPGYQKVVGDVLNTEVNRIHTGHSILTLTAEEVTEAGRNPAPIAEKLGTTTDQLQFLLQGRLDTVATACVDHANSPYGSAGGSCSASFLLCLGCRNARSEPRHIPLQAAMLASMDRRRCEMTDGEWAGRFSTAHQQLSDLLSRQRANSAAAASAVSSQEQDLIDLVLDGGLELR